jgi:hypothetical protein
LAKRFQRRRFLEIDQLETRIACGGHIGIKHGRCRFSNLKISEKNKLKIENY